ncbi:hypothetical protein KQX54_013033 [Cotesia glomerata]|uniref:Uncharacterized protein n=2 Tax=Cotesia glomerata TaxID=32391 RepID=A0AAV7HZD6_COTGL|nr:hypothetical protein KQX54_013033 [Cotesia glomerata]
MEKTKEILNLSEQLKLKLITPTHFLAFVEKFIDFGRTVDYYFEFSETSPAETVEENNNEDNELQSNSDVDGILNVAEEVTAGTSAGGSVVDEQIDEDDMVDNEDDNDSVDEGEIELTEEEKKKQKT